LKSAEGEPLAVVHRDVAAQNIFVPYDGETRLLDFGVARASATAESGPVALAGRVRYMAPEQARRERSDPRGDIFAAGVLLAEAITGNRFWGDGDDNAILEALRLDAIPDPFHAAHDAALVNIVRHALRADPDARPQTIHALRTDLESWLARRPGRGDLGPLRSTMSSFFADERAKVSRTLDGLLTELREAPPAPPMVSEHRIIAIKVGDERLSQQLIPAMPVPLPAPVLSEPTIADADPVHDASNDWYEGPGSSGGMRSAFDRLVASQDRSELTTEDGPRRTRSSGSLAAFRAGEGFGLEGVPSVVGERDEDQSSRVEGLAPEDAPLAKPEVGPAPAAPPPTVVNGLPWPQVAIALVIAAAAFWLLGRY
jgi:serine/threonine-protein kinase